MARMAQSERFWVGVPERVENELCPRCMVSSLVQVPYYMFLGSGEFDLFRDSKMLNVYRRFRCNNGCGFQENRPA